jgi:hypothetical protein
MFLLPIYLWKTVNEQKFDMYTLENIKEKFKLSFQDSHTGFWRRNGFSDRMN